mgnify:CR=1 FL=1
MKSNIARVPQVGEKLHFFDDGKISDSRHYMAVVTHVLTPEQAKQINLIRDIATFNITALGEIKEANNEENIDSANNTI